jgi:hypothetical protein
VRDYLDDHHAALPRRSVAPKVGCRASEQARVRRPDGILLRFRLARFYGDKVLYAVVGLCLRPLLAATGPGRAHGWAPLHRRPTQV